MRTTCNTDAATGVYVSLYRGDTLALEVELNSSEGDVDVTGWQFLCQVRGEDGVLVETMAVTVINASTGLVELGLDAAETAALPPADYRWDLQGTDVDGGVRTLVTGGLRVRADVSR